MAKSSTTKKAAQYNSKLLATLVVVGVVLIERYCNDFKPPAMFEFFMAF